ncbi:MAG TPA: response regulator transcription factor [Vicinamibacterales bacterium]|nr:response regulator transcription factor [Vicinamibacterales bacterium]
MRVLLAGPAKDREWIRRLLADAGVEIAAEGATVPAEQPDGVDAVIEISRRGHGEVQLLESLPEPLTPRERQVLALLAEGLPNKGIASALDISDQTVKFHVAAIIGKLGASNRTDAVRRAVRRGLVTL